jgi:hypothetical protein
VMFEERTVIAKLSRHNTAEKNDHAIRLKHADKLGMTPCLPLLSQLWAEGIAEHHMSDKVVPFYLGWPVIYACEPDSDTVVGLIHYTVDESTADLWIRLGGTARDWRMRGVYRELYLGLREIAREAKSPAIYGGITARNVEATRMARALERSEYYTAFVDRL